MGDAPRSVVVGLARELYDRFIMGGWEPRDSYEIIEDILNWNADNRRIKALEAVADAARDMREATNEYVRVMEADDYVDFGERWREASKTELQATHDLDVALEALAKMEST